MPTLLWRVLSYVGYPDGVEGSLRRVSGALGHAREDRRQLQREHDAEIERLTEEMTRLTH